MTRRRGIGGNKKSYDVVQKNRGAIFWCICTIQYVGILHTLMLYIRGVYMRKIIIKHVITRLNSLLRLFLSVMRKRVVKWVVIDYFSLFWGGGMTWRSIRRFRYFFFCFSERKILSKNFHDDSPLLFPGTHSHKSNVKPTHIPLSCWWWVKNNMHK